MTQYTTLSRGHDFRGSRILLTGAVGVILSFFSKDQGLFLFGVAVFLLFIFLFLNKNWPPIILFCFFFQWFFFQGQMFDALFKGETIEEVDYLSRTKPEVIVLGFIGVFFFFMGVYWIVRKVPVLRFEDYRKFFMTVNLRWLLITYVSIYAFFLLAGRLIWLIPGLSQPLFVLSEFRWGVFFLLCNGVLFQNRYRGLLVLLILLDVGLGFLSFFSNFKTSIYFLFIAYWIFFFRGSSINKVFTFMLLVVLIYLGAFWSSIKKDYRDFLNRGSGAQVVSVSQGEAFDKLVQLTEKFNQKDFRAGLDELVNRLAIVGIFDAVYKRVPQQVPFENGTLWREGITRPFLPRLLFPKKKILSDSKELNYYSGLNINEKTTSVSLSMLAGSYVDFGKWGMHVPLFLFGLFCGWVYYKTVDWGRNPIIGYALTMPLINLWQINEQSINRMVSAMVLYLIVVWLIQKFVLTRFIKGLLSK